MTDALTSTGLTIDSLGDRFDALKTALRAGIGSANLDLSVDQPTGQFFYHLAEHCQQLAELLEEIFSAWDPDAATGQSLTALALVTGTQRREATRGTVTLSLNLGAAVTVPAGALFAVAGDPNNQWATISDTTSVGAGVYAAAAQSTQTGPIQALAGTITVIVSSQTGLNSVTNASNAVPGEDIESDVDLRLRREQELALGGSTNVDAIGAEVSDIDGVQQVLVYENDLWYAVSPMPPKSIEVVYWEGAGAPTAALVAEIAQTIYEEKAAGVTAYGSDTDGAATAYEVVTDSYGNGHQIGFTLAAQRVVEIEYTLVTDSTYPGNAALAAAVAAWADANQQIGEDVYHSRYLSLAFSLVPGVTTVTLMRIRFNGGAWGVVDLAVGGREIATVASGSISFI